MSRILYGQPILQMIAEIVLLPLVLMLVVERMISRENAKRFLWWLLLIVGIYGILNQTLFNRTPEIRSALVNPPFKLLWTAVLHNREIVRSLLLNILLFEPFGAAAVHVLPEKHSIRLRVLLTCLCGLLFSVGLEMCQFAFSLGNAEVDDVICNTLGSFFGALSLPIETLLFEAGTENNNEAEKDGY